MSNLLRGIITSASTTGIIPVDTSSPYTLSPSTKFTVNSSGTIAAGNLSSLFYPSPPINVVPLLVKSSTEELLKVDSSGNIIVEGKIVAKSKKLLDTLNGFMGIKTIKTTNEKDC